jgi:hypothetical protein
MAPVLRFARFSPEGDFFGYFASILKILQVISDERRIRIEGGKLRLEGFRANISCWLLSGYAPFKKRVSSR